METFLVDADARALCALRCNASSQIPVCLVVSKSGCQFFYFVSNRASTSSFLRFFCGFLNSHSSLSSLSSEGGQPWERTQCVLLCCHFPVKVGLFWPGCTLTPWDSMAGYLSRNLFISHPLCFKTIDRIPWPSFMLRFLLSTFWLRSLR